MSHFTAEIGAWSFIVLQFLFVLLMIGYVLFGGRFRVEIRFNQPIWIKKTKDDVWNEFMECSTKLVKTESEVERLRGVIDMLHETATLNDSEFARHVEQVTSYALIDEYEV